MNDITGNSLLLEVLNQHAMTMQQVGVVQGQNAEILRRLENADNSRARIHERLTDVEVDLAETKAAANNAKDACEKLEPIVAELEKKRQRRIGRVELLRCLTFPRVQQFVFGAGSAALAWMGLKLSPLGAHLPDWLAKILMIRPVP